jgi:hypothetical protein
MLMAGVMSDGIKTGETMISRRGEEERLISRETLKELEQSGTLSIAVDESSDLCRPQKWSEITTSHLGLSVAHALGVNFRRLFFCNPITGHPVTVRICHIKISAA